MANPVSTATESNDQIVRNREKSNGAPPPPPPNTALSSSLPPGQFVTVLRKDVPWNFTLQDIAAFIFQLLALTAALVFGAWAIKSYDAAQAANILSSESLSAANAANQVGLLQVCYGSFLEAGSINSIACDYIMEALPIASVASAISISIPSSILTSATSSTTVAASTSTSPTSASASSAAPSASSSAAPSATTSTEVPSTVSVVNPLPSASSAASSSVPQPFPTNTVGASPGSSNRSSLSLGAIIGIIVGSVFGLATVTVVIWLLRHRRPNQQPYLGSGFTPTSEAGLS